MVKGGDLVYDSDVFSDLSRGDAADMVADCLIAVMPENLEDGTRYSNGGPVDAMLMALDMLVQTDEQRQAVMDVLAEWS